MEKDLLTKLLENEEKEEMNNKQKINRNDDFEEEEDNPYDEKDMRKLHKSKLKDVTFKIASLPMTAENNKREILHNKICEDKILNKYVDHLPFMKIVNGFNKHIIAGLVYSSHFYDVYTMNNLK